MSLYGTGDCQFCKQGSEGRASETNCEHQKADVTLNQEVLQRRYLHRTRPLPLTEERQRQSSCGLRHGDGSITCISFHNLNIILGTVPVLAADWLRPDQLSSIQTCQQCSTLHRHTQNLQLLLAFWKYPCEEALCKQAIAAAFSDYWCLLECYEATKLFLVPTVIHFPHTLEFMVLRIFSVVPIFLDPL